VPVELKPFASMLFLLHHCDQLVKGTLSRLSRYSQLVYIVVTFYGAKRRPPI
jgi:hypothetical protein